MRRFLAAAVALAPLCIVSAARADETIGNGIRGPVLTSTEGNVTVNGSVAPGTLTPTPSGCFQNQAADSPSGAAGCPLVSVFLNGTGTSVTNNGTIGSGSLTKTGGATGILIQGGASGDVTNNATINLTDGYNPPTDSNTGMTYGAWSDSTSPQNNYGIRLIAGTGAYTGTITTSLNSTISVSGNNSYGISIEAPLIADGTLTEPTFSGTTQVGSRTIALETNGTITVTGNNSVGINIAAPVGTPGANNGDVWIKNTVTATGIGAVGLQTSQTINGRLTIGGAVSATGYHYTTRPIDSTINSFQFGPYTAKTGALAGVNSETLQGGPAVVIGGSVSGGVLLDTQPTVSDTTTTTSNGKTVTITTGIPNAPAGDQDMDGIGDVDQTTGSITSFGSAPALVVSGTNAITLGAVGTTEPASTPIPGSIITNVGQLYNFGMMLKGTVTANGVYDGFNATAIQLGSAVTAGQNVGGATVNTLGGGGAVNIAGGGLLTMGGVFATAYQATATAIQVNNAVTLGDSTSTSPGITNYGGAISAIANGSGVTATTGFQFEANQRAVAIDIESGANVANINNLPSPLTATSALISAQIAGAYGSAIAIQDKSSKALTINNQGSIITMVDTTPGTSPLDESPTAAYTSAGVCNDTSSAKVTSTTGQGCAIAVDARATSGLTIIQSQSQVNGAGSPIIEGDIYLPTATTANSSLQIQAGAVTAGSINLGAGTVNLQVSNATVAGPLFYSGNQLTIDVGKGGVLADGLGVGAQSAVPNNASLGQSRGLPVQSLTVETGGTLIAAINPQGGSGFFAQTATLQSGARLGVSFVNLPALGSTNVYNVISTPNPANLTVQGQIDTSAFTHPFMLQTVLGSSTGAGGLPVINSPNCNGICVETTASAPAGLNKQQSEFYSAFYQSLAQGSDSDLRDLFLSKTTAQNFFRDYNQLLPVSSSAILLSLASGERSVTRALSDNRPLAEPGETTGWTQEINYFADHGGNAEGNGFRTHGEGVASGVERGTPFGAFGVSLAFTSGDMMTPGQQGQSDLGATDYEAGLYWRFAQGGFRAWAHGSAGYATFNSISEFIDSPTTPLTTSSTSTTTTTDQTTGTKTTVTTQNVNTTAALTRMASANWNGYTLAAGTGVSWEGHFLRRYYLRPEASVEYYDLNQSGYTEENASGGVNGIPLVVGSNQGHMLTTSAMLNFGARFGDVEGQGGLTAELQLGYRDNAVADPGLTSVAFVDNPQVKALLTGDNLSGGGPVIGFRLMAGGPMGYIALEGDVDDLAAYTEYVLMLRAAYRF